MAIKITREPDSYTRMGSEHCAFCGQTTAFWSEAQDVAVCPPCAEDHNESEVPTKDAWCESDQGKGKMAKATLSDEIFVGIFPTGLVYADTSYEVDGDYAKLAFLSFGTLVLDVEQRATKEQARQIRNHAARLRARPGEEYRISQSGQTIVLGYAIAKDAA